MSEQISAIAFSNKVPRKEVIVDNSMFAKLARAESELPQFLRESPSNWNTLYIDYHPPFVERVWRPWGAGRINLHIIHLCPAVQALKHAHDWDAAFRQVRNSYEMPFGIIRGGNEYIETGRFLIAPGSCYTLQAETMWHAVHQAEHLVAPPDEVVNTVMVTDPPLKRVRHNVGAAGKKLSPLADGRRDEILEMFQEDYPLQF